MSGSGKNWVDYSGRKYLAYLVLVLATEVTKKQREEGNKAATEKITSWAVDLFGPTEVSLSVSPSYPTQQHEHC
jgi:hypothetical protein